MTAHSSPAADVESPSTENVSKVEDEAQNIEQTTTATPRSNASVAPEEDENSASNGMSENEGHAPEAGEPTIEELSVAIRELLESSNAENLTRRILREKLEQQFNLTPGKLDERKNEINEAVAKELQQIEAQEAQAFGEEPQAEEESEERESPVSTGKRKAPTQKGGAKRARKTSADDDEEYSAEEEDESASSEDDNEYERATTSKRKGRRGGLKQSQANIMTKAHFVEHALPMESNVGELKFVMNPREFSTGSCGWFYGAKHELDVGGQKVMCQLTFNCAVLGSKLWSKGKRR